MIWINKWSIYYKISKDSFEIATCYWNGRYTRLEAMQEFGLLIDYYSPQIKHI
jgi:hypothetical protein